MKKEQSENLTEIVFIIDRSGSMYPLIDDTIGGFNSFIESQKKLKGKAYLTTVLFGNNITNLHNRVDLQEITPMTKSQYIAGGQTALLDAIGFTIDEVQKRIDNSKSNDRPDKVICAIITDGEENSSKVYNREKVEAMIKHQTLCHNWEFIFLGATMDTVRVAMEIGIVNTVAYTANSIGTKSAYVALDNAVNTVRTLGSIDESWKSYIN